MDIKLEPDFPMAVAENAAKKSDENAANNQPPDLVKHLYSSVENVLRSVMGDPDPSNCGPVNEVQDSIRSDAEQDMRNLLSSYSHLEQFFASRRLVYSQTHPDDVLEARINEMKKAVTRKEELIKRHHTNLDRWANILKHGVTDSQQQSQPTKAEPSNTIPQPNELSARLAASRAHPNIPQPHGLSSMPQVASPLLAQRVLSPPQNPPFTYATPSQANFPNMSHANAGFRPNPNSIHQPSQYHPPPPRSQTPGMGYMGSQQNQMGMYGNRPPQMSSLSAMLSQPTNSPLMPQHHRAHSPGVAVPGPYGGGVQQRMPHWRPGMPHGPGTPHSQAGFPTHNEPDMFHPNQGMHGGNPNMPGQ